MKNMRVFLAVALILAFVVMVAVITVLRSAETSDDEWQTWSAEIIDETFATLQEQGHLSCENRFGINLPMMTLVDGKPSLGNREADEQFLDNIGRVSGKIALVSMTDPLSYYRYDPDAQWSLRDEVLDASTYFDDTHSAPMPFRASDYARSSDACDTLIVISYGLVSGDELEVGDKSTYVDTEVLIIDAKNRQLQHIEYLGTALSERSPNSFRGYLMRGEAAYYLASLGIDGKPGAPYQTPYQSGGPVVIADDEWPDSALVREPFLGTGQFGEYNVLTLYLIERDTLIASQQSATSLTIRLFLVEDGNVKTRVSYTDVVFESKNPNAMVARFADGQGELVGTVGVTTFNGTITLPGQASADFFADTSVVRGCPDCGGEGFINGIPCERCAGTGVLFLYENQPL
ncbi:MAG: hypothetical protein LBK67_04930 [Coriobacteriales bacterium]|jgi:hypothetical protein|nr:hypothetical protein [Coriobacteriales bacterium]